jgi:hypothetical protein
MCSSFEKSLNSILRFHICAIIAINAKDGIRFYPMMDGIYISGENLNDIKSVIHSKSDEL